MERFFNTAGPVNCDIHYCLPPLERWDLDEILSLIQQQKYFVLHAPRQTGKTSCLLALMEYLNAEGRYRAMYVNVEVGQSARENVDAAMRAILGQAGSAASRDLGDEKMYKIFPELIDHHGGHSAFSEFLTRWTGSDPRPAILFLDEVDALIGDTLISLLRQLRAGYSHRPRSFPQSIILCGVRDVRDYRIHSASEKSVITGGSAFNIKAESLRLGDFSREETLALLRMHTAETGQPFFDGAGERVWEFTQGQPWLVNALAYETCFAKAGVRDRSVAITPEMVSEARERLIERRDTHLDQLADKLREDRVRRVVTPILQGEESPSYLQDDDLAYVRDLGLIRIAAGQAVIANPIYQEIIPRELTYGTQHMLHQPTEWYVSSDGRLDMEKLLAAFQEFFREHSEHWVERFDYKEAGPQLLLQAFLQRVVNSGGRIEREYGLGRKRTDLLVIWHFDGSVQKIVIELKILRKSLEKAIMDGINQTIEYMDRCGTDEGHLVIFDRTEGKPWKEKIFSRTEFRGSRTIRIWGM
ncbi:MAG: AAA family ATPase [Thermodesulfobacteriota bacterium]